MADVTEKQRRAFTHAAWNNDVATLRKTLAEYPDAVHWRHPDSGGTALIYAAHNAGFTADAFAFLLGNGSDINARDDEGRTALMLAAKSGNENYARALMERGADANVRSEGKTALDFTQVRNTPGTRRVAEMLLDAEAEELRRKGLPEPVAVRKPLQLKI